MTTRILVADDDPDVLNFLRIMLEHRGYQVIPATSGTDALARALDERPDAILLDMMMPGLDGLEVCRRLRADPRTAALPILALTARVGWDHRAEGLRAGIDDYVTKPFDTDDLLHRLEAARASEPSASDRLATETMQALMVTLGCQLVWLLAADPDERILTTAAIVSAPTEVRGRQLVQQLRGGAPELRLSFADGVFAKIMEPGQQRLSWPQSDLGQLPGGADLAAALEQIDVRAISAVPILARGKPTGLLIFDSPRMRAESTRLAALAANVAAAALSNYRLVADLRHSQERAQSERAFRQMILDTMGDGLMVLDAAGRIEFVNERLLRLSGYDAAELVGQPATVLLGPSRSETGRPTGTTLLEGQLRCKSGEALPTQMVRTPRPKAAGLVVLVADLSAEKRIQAELFEQNRRLDALIQATRTMTSSLNLAEVPGRILEEAARVLNAEGGAILLVAEGSADGGSLVFAAATGPGTESLRGTSLPLGAGVAGWVAQSGLPALVDGAEDDPRFSAGVDIVTGLSTRSLLAVPMRVSNGVIGVLELLNKRSGPFATADRTLLESLALSAAVAIQNARLYGRLETSLKALADSQAQLVKAEKLAAAGQMAAVLAHEINNPLQSVRTALTLAGRADLPDTDRRKCLALAESETQRLAGLVQRMLEFYRPSKGHREPVDLRAVVEKVIALAEPRLRQNRIEVVRDWPADLPPISGIADELTQVFLNLALNACDAMHERGSNPPGRLTLRLRLSPAGDGLLAEVADAGAGISPEDREHLYEPFFTTKATGTGLGLAVSHDIVERHGGRMQVDSRPGEGTTFRISLPLRPPAAGRPSM